MALTAAPMSPHARTWPDEELVGAARNGDPRALAAVAEAAYPRVRRVAGAWCATPEDAEDVTQETLMILCRSIGTLRGTGALDSWLLRVARRESLRHRRGTDRHTGGDDEGRAAPAPSVEDAVLRRLEVEQVAGAMGRLPRDQLQVLIMRDLYGRPGRDVAGALGLSEAAMKSRLHRARSFVRDSLDRPSRVARSRVQPVRPVARSVMLTRPSSKSPVPGSTLGTPWYAYRDALPKTKRSPEANSRSV